MVKATEKYLKYGDVGFKIGFITGLATAFFIWTSLGRRIAKLPIEYARAELERKISEIERRLGL